MLNGLRMIRRGWILGLLLLAVAPSASAERATVALDLSGLDAAAYRRLDAVQLESRAVLRLVQEGFAVVGPTAGPGLTIRVTATATALVLTASEGGRRVVPISDEGPELHFEVAQKIVELAREAFRARIDAGPPSDAGAPSLTIAAPADAGTAPALVPPSSAELSVGGGGLYRGGSAVDPRAQLDVRLPLAGNLAVDLSLAITASRGAGISILEPELLAGVGYRFALGERWALEPRLLAGVLLHVYSVEDPTAIDLAGSRLDFLMSLAVSLTWRPVGDLLVGVHLAPGFSSRTREHLRQATSLWRREALRLGFGLTLGWRF